MSYLDDLDNKIEKAKDRVSGGEVIMMVGVLGILYGVLSKSDANTISGLIVETGGFLFNTFNHQRLVHWKLEKASYDSSLSHNDDDDAHLGGKHFRK